MPAVRALVNGAVLAAAATGLLSAQASANSDEARCTYTRSEICGPSKACETQDLSGGHPYLLSRGLAEMEAAWHAAMEWKFDEWAEAANLPRPKGTPPPKEPRPFEIRRCDDSGCRPIEVSVETEGIYMHLSALGYLLIVDRNDEPLSQSHAGDFVEVVSYGFSVVEVNHGHCPFEPFNPPAPVPPPAKKR